MIFLQVCVAYIQVREGNQTMQSRLRSNTCFNQARVLRTLNYQRNSSRKVRAKTFSLNVKLVNNFEVNVVVD
jgi:hypothetical protein